MPVTTLAERLGEQILKLSQADKRAKVPRCGTCGSTKGRHYFGLCPEKYQPGIISGQPFLYWSEPREQ